MVIIEMFMKRNGFHSAVLAVLIAYASGGLPVRAQEEMRVWKNPQGREIKATMMELKGTDVTLRLESGTITQVPLRALSPLDQTYVKQAAARLATAAPAASQPVTGPLTWPLDVVVDPKDLDIKVGVQNPAAREYEYKSGSFRYISKAPLSPSVMKAVAVDFELARQLMVQLPWGWQPQPKTGGSFKVYLTETQQDYINVGGSDNTNAGSKDGYAFVRLSALGLKKLGARYAYDLKEKAAAEGEVMTMIVRLLIGDMTDLMLPWAAMGMETFTREVAYHKGVLKLSRLETALKTSIANENEAKPNAKRMVAFLKFDWKDLRRDVNQLLSEYYLDGEMLVYFFGYLDGDGKGSKFHEYGRAVAQETLQWRVVRKGDARAIPRPDDGRSFPDWAQDLLKIVIAGRSDAQLQAEITAKFKAMGIKME